MDRERFMALYEAVSRDLYRFAYYTLGNKHDSEDAVSEAVVAAYEGFHKLRSLESFRPWIFKILSIKCKRKMREYANRTLPLDDELPDMAGGAGHSIEEAADVQKAYFTLEREDRLILSMSVFGGYNSREIGRILKMNSNTVRSRQKRALEKLKQQLEE